MVGVLLLKAVYRRQRLLCFAVAPVDVSQVDQGLLRIVAKGVARLQRFKLGARLRPVARAEFFARVAV